MPNCDPRDVFYYSILTLMIDSYIIPRLLHSERPKLHSVGVSEWNRIKGLTFPSIRIDIALSNDETSDVTTKQAEGSMFGQ